MSAHPALPVAPGREGPVQTSKPTCEAGPGPAGPLGHLLTQSFDGLLTAWILQENPPIRDTHDHILLLNLA